eukprot:g3562.t1
MTTTTTAITTKEDATETNMRLLEDSPRFVILGVQKCGTTALYAYLCDHPRVISAVRKETHFFDWRWNEMCAAAGEISENDDDPLRSPVRHLSAKSAKKLEERVSTSGARMGAIMPGKFCCDREKKHATAGSRMDAAVAGEGSDEKRNLATLRNLRQKYLSLFPVRTLLRSRLSPTTTTAVVSGEATPSYLIYGETVARRLRAIAPRAKLIVAVRNPVERAYSQYQMARDPVGSDFVKHIRGTYVLGDRTFAEAVEEDRRALKRAGLTIPSSSAGYSAAQLSDLERSYFSKLPLQHGAFGWLGRGLYAAQISLWLRHFPRSQIEVVCIDDMRDPEGCRREMRRLYAYLSLSPHALSDEATRPRNTKETRKRTYGPMDPGTRRSLEAFFAPHNEALFRMCGRRWAWGR